MNRILKWAGYGLAGAVGACALTIGGAFAVSEAMIRWPVETPRTTLVASRDAGAVTRGLKVARLNGCHDCHGDKLEGRLFHDEMPIIRAWGPNLALLLAEQSDADFDRAIRHGVAGDGRRLWMMPSSAFTHLTDQEMADLMAYLRTYKPVGEEQSRFQVGPVGRVAVLLGKFRSEADTIRETGGLKLEDLGPGHALGRRLARACVECHGQTLEGSPMLKSPNLDMAASYDPADFEKLLRTGVAAGDRKLGLMTTVAPARFNSLSDQEIAALQDYLKARAQRRFAASEAAATP